MDRPPRPYGHVAWCYDAAASAYSLGAIGRAKRWHVGRLQPGDRVLYAGAGTGREVAAACAAHPTIEAVCVEPCPAMARRLRRRLSRWVGRVTVVEEQLRAADRTGTFDWVCGHFFFNVFDVNAMPGMLALAASHVRPGGRLVVADFAPAAPCGVPRLRRDSGRHTRPTGGMGHVLRAAYYRPVNVAGWALQMCALHPIYDYTPALSGLEFEVEERVGFVTIPGVPAFYEVVCAEKRGG